MTTMKKATGHLEEDSIIVRKKAYKYETELYSTFIMGGYEEAYMKSDLSWFDTSECEGGWNLTASYFSLHIVQQQSESSLTLIGESFTVQPQVAYPFIGVPQTVLDSITSVIKDQNKDA